MLNLYHSSTSSLIVRGSSQQEIDDLQKAYDFINSYVLIEQNYSIIHNNKLELDDMIANISHGFSTNFSEHAEMALYDKCEINRKFLNFLSATYAYHQFMKESYLGQKFGATTLNFESYFNTLKEQKDVVAVGYKLRHYYNHWGHASDGIQIKFEYPNPPFVLTPVTVKIQMNVNKLNLNGKFDWGKIGQLFIDKQSNVFDILPIINQYFTEWSNIHKDVRLHYSTEFNKAKKVIQDIFIESKKDVNKDAMVIVDDSDVSDVPGLPNAAFIKNPFRVHGGFIKQVDFYLNTFK